MKNLFEISSEERNRILEMHINATKKQYLFEQKRTLNITVTDEKGEKIPYAAILDSGDKTNGVITDNNGFGILNNFVGPSFEASSVGMSTETVTPENGKNDITVVMKQSGTLKTLEIKVQSYFGKIVDSATEKPIQGAKIEGLYVDNDFSGYTWTSDTKGMFESNIKYSNLIISAEGYDELKYTANLSELGSKEKPNIIKLTKTIIPKEIPDELKALIGKVFRFLDSKMKKPGSFKILDAEYVIDGNRTTTLLKTGYCQTQNDCEDEPSFTISYDCDRVAFRVQKISDKWKDLTVDFVIKNYLYCNELQSYLLDITKTCTLNKP